MRISTKGRYAMRMMIEFALHPDRTTKINEVAKNQNISEKYLEQIVAILTKAGYVNSVRGAQGGYRLAHPAKDYSVGDILRLTEGSLAPVACLDENGVPCGRDEVCVSRKVFAKIEDAINGVVDNITLEDLLKDDIKSNHRKVD